MSPGLALFLLVLFVLVALAGASFFRHTLAVLLLFLALPLGLILKAAFGTGVSVIHRIADTLRLMRAARRPTRRSQPAARSESDRSRIAA